MYGGGGNVGVPMTGFGMGVGSLLLAGYPIVALAVTVAVSGTTAFILFRKRARNMRKRGSEAFVKSV